MEFTKYPITVHYLQVMSRDQILPKRSTDPSVTVTRVDNPEPDFLQWLYRTVGKEWYWASRYYWSLNQWSNRFADSAVSLWVMEYRSEPAGYYEFEEQQDGDIEFSSFGLLPAAIGKGLGGHMLTDGLERAFELGASRAWLHTCSLDHPNALKNYQARGMELYKSEKDIQLIPHGWPLPSHLPSSRV
tara:strand:- start:865 stop:1425 length:561 start_codon:yes stop_codon:yes gene_type:complete